MKQEAHLHDVNLFVRLEPGAEKVALHARAEDPGLHVVLHRLRDQAATMDRMGRQTPVVADVDPLEYRAYHAGAADALEEIFWGIWRDMQGGEEAEDTNP